MLWQGFWGGCSARTVPRIAARLKRCRQGQMATWEIKAEPRAMGRQKPWAFLTIPAATPCFGKRPSCLGFRRLASSKHRRAHRVRHAL